jgi:hypothetical protein
MIFINIEGIKDRFYEENYDRKVELRSPIGGEILT